MVGCGFFGKLPSRGDFVDRRLPHWLVRQLDDWLQESLSLRMELDEDWTVAFQASPCWHFATGLGGDPPGLAGVLIPSRDRVGRDFPLLLATPLSGAPRLAFPTDWGEAYGRLAALAREAVEKPLDPDELADRLVSIPPPPALRGGTIPAMQPGLRLNLQGRSLTRTLAAFPQRSGLHTGGLWWHHGSQDHPPCVLVSAGLPPPQAARFFWHDDWGSAPWRPIGH